MSLHNYTLAHTTTIHTRVYEYYTRNKQAATLSRFPKYEPSRVVWDILGYWAHFLARDPTFNQ